ncbi:MAG: sugar ABC transporter substrate-binding protein [Lachnospiraceae bacterium]|nr:sugar ABC transporter substrate-binding protein [Lachnospiraceae bacterium]
MLSEENQRNIKSDRNFWSILILVNIVILTLLFLVFFGNKDYSVNQKRNSYLIGASYMTMNNEFYKVLSEEISAKVEAEGDMMILRDPALDENRQIEQISEMLDMGIDVLVLTPVNWESLTDVLKRAKSQGVFIVVVDTEVYDDDLVDCTITSDNYAAGVIVGEYFLEQHDRADVIVMTHETAKSGLDRVKGFIDTVSVKNGINIVQKIECEGQLEIAMPKLQEAIDSKLSFDSVFCLNDLAGVGVVAALEENHLLDKVSVYGVDASPDSKALINEGMMTASAAQFPSEIGSKAADVIYKLLNGESVEKKILVSVELITQDNVEEFGIDRW